MKYCIYCGTKLIEYAKFCHHCGKEIPNPVIEHEKEDIHEVSKEEISIEEQNNDISNMGKDEKFVNDEAMLNLPSVKISEGQPITLQINGVNIELSKEIRKLKTVRDSFENFAKKNVERFEDYAKSYIKEFDDIYEKGIPISIMYIKDAISNSVEIAKNVGISDMTYEWMSMLYEDIADYNSYFKYYEEIIDALDDMASKLASYRATRRSTVSYWQGGGFGIKGAIKGQIEATALNLGTNVVREIEYAIEDAKDKKTIKKAKEKLYRNIEMYKHLVLIVYNCSFMPYYALLPILEEENLVSAEAENNDEVEKQVSKVFKKYIDGQLSYDDARKELFKNVEKYPFCSIPYIYLKILSKEMNEDIIKVTKIMRIEALYKQAEIILRDKLVAEVNENSEEEITDFSKKIKIISHLENADLISWEEADSIRGTLRYRWGEMIKFMPEFKIDEIEEKVKEYEKLQLDYGSKTYSNEFKRNSTDLERLRTKLEDKKILTCLDMNLDEIRMIKNNVMEIVEHENYESLWNETDKQNGYAQEILYRFYMKRVEKIGGTIRTVEAIADKCPYLDKKRMEGNKYATFIYDAMVEKIRTNAYQIQLDEKHKIHIQYLHKLNKAVDEGIIYAKYCLVQEISNVEYWCNYEAYTRKDNTLCEYAQLTGSQYLKEAANAFVPSAIQHLADIYNKKRNCTGIGYIERSIDKADKLYAIKDILTFVEEMKLLSSNYERDLSQEYIFCRKCGKAIKVGKKFCSQCGTKVN